MEKGIWLKMLLAQIGKTNGQTHHNLFW
jgi:hypothetical protein